MSLLQNIFKYFATNQNIVTAGLSSGLPLTLLLFGLDALLEVQFSCPCRNLWNKTLSFLMFAVPFLFSFMLMLIITRPLKKDTWCLCIKAMLFCLLPPAIWLVLMFYDGDYVACSRTYWKGVYVYDEALNTKWCKPIENITKTESELLDETLDIIVWSRVIGFYLLLIFSIVTCFFVALFDICGCAVSCSENTEERPSGQGQEQNVREQYERW